MATKAEIATLVAQKLKVLETGATIDSDDSTLIQGKYDSRYQILAAQDLVSWGSGDDIPTGAEFAVTALVARDCLSEFHVDDKTMQAVIFDADRAIDDLMMLEHLDYVPEESEVNFY